MSPPARAGVKISPWSWIRRALLTKGWNRGTDLVNSVVIAHRGRFSLDQVKAIKVPSAWICTEEVMFFPDSFGAQSEAELAGRKDKPNFVEYEFKEYKGTAYGFASHPNMELPDIKEVYEGAFDQTVEWFENTLTHA